MVYEKRNKKLDLNSYQKFLSLYETMLYCLKCKNTESKNPNCANRNIKKLIVLSSCAVCDGKTFRFIK